MWDRTNGGAGRKYAGSSAERGRDVQISISVVWSMYDFAMVIASLGLSNVPREADRHHVIEQVSVAQSVK